MTALSDFVATVKSWIDDFNPSDALVTSWVRIAEERMNNELRVDEMIVRASATFDDNCSVLPDDWLKTLYVMPQGCAPYRFVSNVAYFDEASESARIYTNVGRTLFVWPPVDPEALTKFDVGYYAKVPPLGNEPNAIMTRYPSVYLNCTLAAGAPYLIEDDRLQTFAALATAGIKMANDQAIAARFSGSPLTHKRRSFG